MKIKPGFMLRQLGENYVVVALGPAAEEFKGIIRLNPAGAFLWKRLGGAGASEDELVAALLGEYDVDEAAARADTAKFLADIADMLEA